MTPKVHHLCIGRKFSYIRKYYITKIKDINSGIVMLTWFYNQKQVYFCAKNKNYDSKISHKFRSHKVWLIECVSVVYAPFLSNVGH